MRAKSPQGAGKAPVARPAKILVAHPGRERLPEAFAVLAALRCRGLSAVGFPDEKKHAQQMRWADRMGIEVVVTVDADGTLHAKHLATGDTIRAKDADELANALGRG